MTEQILQNRFGGLLALLEKLAALRGQVHLDKLPEALRAVVALFDSSPGVDSPEHISATVDEAMNAAHALASVTVTTADDDLLSTADTILKNEIVRGVVVSILSAWLIEAATAPAGELPRMQDIDPQPFMALSLDPNTVATFIALIQQLLSLYLAWRRGGN